MSIAVSCEGLSKSYWIKTLQPNGRLKRVEKVALDSVSFTLSEGEVLGVIGRNGAGKSTLLKILSRITAPTRGRAVVCGVVASLLEVGTGMHPEMTGRENIFLNGALLGMSKKDVVKRLDEIVEFAGVSEYVDTPIKRYSSGMKLRLAFAVAAHLSADIMIVDEVLAVGDAEFQAKCLNVMRDGTRQGRTTLFVSHNLVSVKAFCNRALLLSAGRVACEGDVDEVVDAYLLAGTEMAATGVIPEDAQRIGTGEARFRRVELLNVRNEPLTQIYLGQTFRVALTFDVLNDVKDAVIEVGISTLDHTRITLSSTIDGAGPPLSLGKGRYQVCLDLSVVLLPRQYTLDVAIHHFQGGVSMDFVESSLNITVVNVAETGADRHLPERSRGFIRPEGLWHRPINIEPAGAAEAVELIV